MSKIFIVDDEAIVVTHLKSLLQGMDYEVVGTALSSEEALRRVKKLEPDLVLMDIILVGSDMDGIEVSRIIKDEYDIPVIFLTGYSDSSLLSRAKGVDPSAYILKPFQEVEVKAAIEIALTKKESERRLRESEERYRLLYENAPTINIIVNLDLEIQDMNSTFIEALGFTKSEVFGKSIFDLVKEEKKQLFSDQLTTALMGQYTPELDIDFRAKDGKYHTILLSPGKKLIYKCGKPVHAILIGIDITERKKSEKELQQSEARLYTIIQKNADGILIIDKKGEICFVNPAAEKLFGIHSCDLIGEVFGYPIGYGDLTEVEIVQGHNEKITVELQVVETEWDGEQHFLASLRDVTARKEAKKNLINAYQELKNTQKQLIQSEKLAAIGRFASGVSHELKNPLGIILGGIEYLERKINQEDDELTITIEKMKNTIFRADKIIKDLLKYSKPSEMKTHKICPIEIIEDALDLFMHKFSFTNVEINKNYSEHKFLIEVDRNQIQQVLFNILDNAIHSMPDGGIINIRVDMEKNYLEHGAGIAEICIIEISDSGQGIPSDHLDRVFEPFFSTKKKIGGTGLGLSVVKTIISNHDGEIFIKSELDKGTKVTILLPIK